MKRNIFLLVALFLVIGTRVCAQNYSSNYFTSGKLSVILPANAVLSTEDSLRWAEIEEEMGMGFTDDFCEEDGNFWYPTYYFAATESELIEWLEEDADTVFKQDGFIVWWWYEDEVYAIHLDSLIYEERWYEEDDNPFFEQPGNKLWETERYVFKNVNGYLLPEKNMYIYYDEAGEIFSSERGILCEITMTYTYPYFELLDADDNNKSLVEIGNRQLYEDCMGFTSIAEMQANVDMTVYPNPANERITVSLSSFTDENVNMEVFNMLGTMVLQHQGQGEQIDMDIHSLPAGVYIVRCTNMDKVITKRFVKQ